jgi:3-oxoadipate enol-lactonase
MRNFFRSPAVAASLSPSLIGELAFDRRGRGAAVVFLHGMGGGREDWAGELEAFGRNRMAIALDIPGYGGSALTAPTFSISAAADEIARFLAALDGAPVHLVGLSLGGRIAMSVAHRHPHLLRSLTIAATTSVFRPDLTSEARGAALAARADAIESAGAFTQIAEQDALLLAGDNVSLQRRTRATIERLGPARYAAGIRALIDFDARPWLGSIDIPTLVIGGGRDAAAPVDALSALAAALIDARLEIVPDAGHIVNLDQPAAFEQHLAAFLDHIEARDRYDTAG